MAITNASTLAEYASGIGTQNSTLTVDSGNKRVGVGTTNPLGTFQVGSGVTFWGDAGIGSFTSLKLSGDTDSTSISTGALTVTGGVGIGLSLTVGGDVSVGGTITYEDVTNVDSIGIVTARSGVRIVGGGLTCVGVATFASATYLSSHVDVAGELTVADMLGHTGDTHTKLSFPANDTIAFTTGDTERLRIDLRGNMGLGVNSIDNAESGNDTVFAIKGKGSSYAGRIEFQDSSGNKDGGIRVDSGILDLHADPDASTTNSMVRFIIDNSEKVRITSTGRVGIGSIIPQTALDVLGELTLPHNNTLRWALGTTTKFDMYSNSGGTLIFRSTGNERMRINASGQLLLGHHTSIIGHSGIDGYLQVTGAGTDDSSMTMSRFSADTWCPFITMGKSRNATKGGNTIVQDDDYLGYINFAGNDGTDFNNPAAYIAAQVDGTPGTDDMPGRLVFATTADGSNSATERLRIKSNGFLGIGTNNPARKFHVNDDNSEIALYQSGNANGSYINYKLGANGAELGMIGSGAAILSGGADASDFGIRSSGDLCFSSNGHAEKMRLDTNGKLGIGIISPDSLLHVHNGSAGSIAASSAANLTIESSASDYNVLQFLSPATAAQQIRFGDPSDNGAGYINYNHSNNALTFGTAGPEKMRITSYGDVGIGSATPSDPSWGTEGNSKFLSISGTTYGCLSLEGSNGAYTKWTMGAGDSRLYMGYSENTGTHLLDLVNGTNAVEVMAGNLVMRAADKGIDFTGGSSIGTAANILHDYEEGTWTPTLLAHDGSSWGNVTLDAGNLYAKYTKIGNLCHVQIYAYNFHVNSAHDSDLAGFTLPFTVFNGMNGYGILTTAHFNCFETAGQTNFYAQANTTRAGSVVENSTNYNTWSGSSGRYLMVGGSYITA